MENKRALKFVLTMAAIIIGVGLFKQFDLETLRFKKIGLSVVYFVTLMAIIYVLMRNRVE